MKIQVIINSRSHAGRGNCIRDALREICSGSIIHVAWTACAGHATALARKAARGGYDTIVAVGGDGTINEILNGVVGTSVTLGIIPTGTANDLASHYRIPARIEDACAVIAAGHTSQADVMCVNGWHLLTCGGIGFPCRTLAVTRALRRWRIPGRWATALTGKKLYVLSSLIALFRKRESGHAVQIQSSDGVQVADVFSLTVSNQPTLGKKFHIAPGAVNDDGQLDICVIENGNRAARQLRIVVETLRGRHISLPEVRLFRTACLSIQSARPLAFFGDGEIALCDTRFDIRVIPGAIRVLTPRTTEES